ncbi:MAG: PolC-type DNA polymerase III [Clostridia bacterium]|nr:PolC-type DNA polymerase III [Clostridia bacterium]
MSYEHLMELIYREFPHLRGQLERPQVVFVRAKQKVYVSFKSMTLVEEATFLRMEKLVQQCFPATAVALRVVSPGLAEDFRRDVGPYKQVLVDFLRRNYPGIAPWINDIDWSSDGKTVTLTFPDEFSRLYLQTQGVERRLGQAIRDIFDTEMAVELTVSGDYEQVLQDMRRLSSEAVKPISVEELHRRNGAPEKGAARTPRKPGEHHVSDAVGRPVLGRSIADSAAPIRELNPEAGVVVIQGDIFKLETKELRGGETVLVSFAVTDYASSVLCKVFLDYRATPFGRRRGEAQDQPPITREEREAVQARIDRIKVGMRVKIRGRCAYDTFAREMCITVRDMVEVKKEEREDRAKDKRVELHMHTKMSAMDALASAGDLVKRAAAWGHPAVAITDHGVLQAFPDAFRAAKAAGIKLIPGCEGYLIDEQDVVERATERPLQESIVVLDFETTGLNPRVCRVMEIGAVRLTGGTVEDSLSLLVNPHEAIPERVSKLTGITDSMVADAESAETAIPKLMAFIGDSPIAAHNAAFDGAVLRAELQRLGLHWDGPVLDTLTMARKLYPDMKSFKLNSLCKKLGVSLKNAHRAVHDAGATAQCLAKMYAAAQARGLNTLADLNRGLKGGAIGSHHHIILLAATQEGLVNLNRLVSISHLQYFRRQPHMPRQEILRHREGLIIGSACSQGELYEAVLRGEPWEELKRIASFYDYLEIQPVANDAYLIREGSARDEDELREHCRTIVRLGEELGLPVAATGDVHFLDPHNAINRAIIQAGMDFDDADFQPPLYFKTTEEMLADFAFLGPEKAREVVIDTPRMIADRVEAISLFPKHPQNLVTFQPKWDDAEDNIVRMTWATAREMYGDKLPQIVEDRLNKELRSIVGYGYCTLYNIAERLVAKSMEYGYLVGSRGSVGSSLVARMCNITEVNALPAHYRCPHCRKGYFDVDWSRYHVGVDLPDRDCPVCGRPLVKDGFDIPFEVFLGFKGDKVPDIDLNFSGEVQNIAHHYVEELFGHDHVFRAGTISGLAEKTAYGYVSRYLEERGITAGNTEKERLAAGCEGVKRTTGQHPGGMVVVPKEYDINQFTAVQHPADDMESDFTTTHFDFNSMHDVLVKLDCLGHDDPTMMHELEALTGINFRDVPLDDPLVRQLFSSPAVLGVTEDEILCSTGTYGIPEFGTGFVRGMLDATHPTTMEELLRISGLSHGTDVWLGNAQDLITSGTATLSECVCCRDDIMNYLITKGVEPSLAFATMESVRKGKGLKPEMEKAMVEHGVPAWYLESCRKIKYMFPKGHAVAYVTMALRVAWFKVHYPAAYYCAYFTVRGDGFDATTMLVDPQVCRERILAIRNSDEKENQKQKEEATALELVLEMSMRGIRLLPVDLYKSDPKKFLIEEDGLRCPLTSLVGLGESAALPIVQARKDGRFLSVEDLRARAHLGQSVVDILRAHGSLRGMPETSQVSMF